MKKSINNRYYGFHLVKSLVKKDYEIVGLDNINDYYNVNLKYGWLRRNGYKKKQNWNYSPW